MKVVAFNGSPRRNGNTFDLLNVVLTELRSKGIETELVQIGGLILRGCISCYGCWEEGADGCVLPDDGLNGMVAKMRAADGIILASPVYYGCVTSELKALIDRGGFSADADTVFKRKVGAAVVVARRDGCMHTFDTINHFFTINQMVVAGSSYWNMALGRDRGEALKDEEAVGTMKTLAANMAWLLDCTAARRDE